MLIAVSLFSLLRGGRLRGAWTSANGDARAAAWWRPGAGGSDGAKAAYAPLVPLTFDAVRYPGTPPRVCMTGLH